MLLRIATSSSAAVIVTGALLFVMAGFIAQRAGPRITTRSVDFASFVYAPPPPPVVARRQPPQPPPEPLKPPQRTQTDTGGTTIAVLDPTPRTFEPPSGPGDLDMRRADGDLLPIVQISPTYPPSAERRGLEGYVIVAFAVSANGSVENVRIVESSHAVFERAAIEAAERFRFRPRVVDGRGVRVDNVRRRVTFTLDN